MLTCEGDAYYVTIISYPNIYLSLQSSWKMALETKTTERIFQRIQVILFYITHSKRTKNYQGKYIFSKSLQCLIQTLIKTTLVMYYPGRIWSVVCVWNQCKQLIEKWFSVVVQTWLMRYFFIVNSYEILFFLQNPWG